MSVTADTLLSLTRMSLGKDSVDSLPNVVSIPWNEVYEQALVQGVCALCSSVVAERGETWGLDEDLRFEWLGQTMVVERLYARQLKSISKLAHFYAESGLSMMLLKGYGLSLNYPVSQRRPVGDIDIFLMNQSDEGRNNRFSAWQLGDRSVHERLGIDVDEGHEHHTTFVFEGHVVENHYDFINTKASWTGRWVEAKLKELATSDVREVPVGVGKDGLPIRMFLPSPDFNAIFLMRHMGQHCASERILLRHLLDWALFLEHFSSQVHWNWVVPFWKQIGILEFARCVNRICCDSLGFDEALFHGQLSSDEALSARVLNDILSPEFDEMKPQGGLMKVVFFKTRRFFANGWKRRLVFKESLFESFILGSIAHLQRFKTIKD